MSAHPTDGGPAFPVPMIPCGRDGDYTSVELQGMPLRDYFAAKALGSWIAALDSRDLPDEDEEEVWAEHALEVGKVCYRYADAMLLAREAKR